MKIHWLANTVYNRVSNPQTENNADPDAIKLDDEMEKVFGSSEHYSRKEMFDIKQLSDAMDPVTKAPASLKANRSESDFAAVSRKSNTTSAMKRRDSDNSSQSSAMPTSHRSTAVNEDDDEPLVSERARGAKQHDSDSQEDLRRVKFSEAGSPVRRSEANEADDSYDEEQLEDLRKRKGYACRCLVRSCTALTCQSLPDVTNTTSIARARCRIRAT